MKIKKIQRQKTKIIKQRKLDYTERPKCADNETIL
jgi:hypothetical protein